MKKFVLLLYVVVGSLALPTTASASLITSIFHDYGIGQFDPGGNDVLTTDGVIVSDQSHERFNDLFDFSFVTDTITSLELILDFSHAGPSCPFGICGIGEIWQARLQGSDSSGTSDDLFAYLNSHDSPQSFYLDSTSDTGSIDVWNTSLSLGSLGLWFSESSLGKDKFNLNSARLNVYGEHPVAAVPAPASLALFGIGSVILGLFSRRRQRSAS